MDEVILVENGIYLLDKHYQQIKEFVKDYDVTPYFTFKTDQNRNKYTFWYTRDQKLLKLLYLKFVE